jgi:hypothetical protein
VRTSSEKESQVSAPRSRTKKTEPVEEAAAVEVAVPSRPSAKFAIVGFTFSRELTPWDEEGWTIAPCNNLWRYVPDTWQRLYDLHDHETIESDEEHVKFLRGETVEKADGTKTTIGDRPVFVWKPKPEWPTAVAFPKDAIIERFGRYFTNSIAWITAHALMEMEAMAGQFADEQIAAFLKENEGAEPLAAALHSAINRDVLTNCALHIYGVDMAQGTEYAAQRPSCEYFLGLAAGMGVQIHVPDTSDLLKCAYLYGVDDDSPLRSKLEDRSKELKARQTALAQQMQMIDQQKAEYIAAMNQLAGALETTDYFRGVWLNAAANRDGSAKTSEGRGASTQGD